MPIVDVKINHRSYQVACDQGQELRLNDLISKLDQGIKDLAIKFPKASDSYLFLLHCITMQDQIDELLKNNSDDSVAESINVIAEYIENLAQKIENIYSEK